MRESRPPFCQMMGLVGQAGGQCGRQVGGQSARPYEVGVEPMKRRKSASSVGRCGEHSYERQEFGATCSRSWGDELLKATLSMPHAAGVGSRNASFIAVPVAAQLL